MLKFSIFSFVSIGFLFSLNSLADATPTIDGDMSDWPQDAWTYADADDMDYLFGLLEHRDIVNVWVTDDNIDNPSDPSNGNLYVAVEVSGTVNPRYLGFDIDFFLNLDTDLDGFTDVTLELTDDLIPAGGDFAWSGSFAEFSIPYDLLGLNYTNDTIGISVSTSGLVNVTDNAPEPGEGDNGFIIYDGTEEDVEPLSVRMLAHWAVALDSGGVLLSWKTGAERRNAGFHVYRKTGRNWQRLNDIPIPGLGDSAFGRGYSFFDVMGKKGNMYRIDDVAYGGKITSHSIMEATGEDFFMRGSSTWRSRGASALWQQKETASVMDRLHTLFGMAAVSPKKAYNGKMAVSAEVDVDGLQFVAYDALGTALGQRSRVQRGIRVMRNGKSIPTLMGQEGIYFLGTVAANRYTDAQAYVLSRGTPQKMRRKRVSLLGCDSPVRQYEDVIPFAQNNLYNVSTPSGDPFQWAMAFVGVPAKVNFYLTAVTDDAATISVSVAGLANVVGMDHTAQLSVNGVSLDVFEWEGRDKTHLSATVPAGILKEGENTLALSILNTGTIDLLWIDSVTVSMKRPLRALPEGLYFKAPAGQCVEVDGLIPGSAYRLFDVSDDSHPVELTGFRTTPQNPDGIVFNPPTRRNKSGKTQELLLVSLSDALEPSLGDPFPAKSPLASRNNQADYLIITHPMFTHAAKKMAAFHSGNGLTVKIVTTDDAYNAFNYGNKHPSAIRNLIATAHAVWRQAPRYVLLMGAASVDPLGYLGLGNEDFVPAPFHKTLADNYEAASDGYYVDGLLGVSIGRLAVETVEEANGVVDKIIGWRGGGAGLSLFIADRDENVSQNKVGVFESAAEMQIEVTGLDARSAVRLYRDDAFDAAADFVNAVDRGLDVVNFNGHAFLSGWSSSPELATVSSVGALSNERLFVLLSWSCFDGAFTGPWDDSLAWAFVSNPKGGAVAAVASSSLSQPASVDSLSYAVNYQLASGLAETIGEALYNAKHQLAGQPGIPSVDAIATFNLLGDPATPNPWR
ncbi:MAG: hypothetical protein JXR76_03650 [Deltaproteobacteria bacterium]|nr:hypothetical protein [Deltaproteobacteria bacterium]